MRSRLLLIILLMAPVAGMMAVDLREELDPEVFRKSGLEKLTPEELASLNDAVAYLIEGPEKGTKPQDSVSEVQQGASAAASDDLPQGEDRFGIETVKQRVEDIFRKDSPNAIESRIVGEFTGWEGGTRFKLENGQIWRQSEPDRFVVRKMTNPKVTIRRGMFSSYLLKVEGYNSSVKVERVE